MAATTLAARQFPNTTTKTTGDNTNAVASTAFVQQELTANALSLSSAVFVGGTSGNPLKIIQTFNAQTASYTLVLADAGIGVTMSNASANNLTVPTNASVAFPIGTTVLIASIGVGQTTIVASGGVTINSAGGALKLRVRYSSGTLIKTATDTWLLLGDIST